MSSMEEFWITDKFSFIKYFLMSDNQIPFFSS